MIISHQLCIYDELVTALDTLFQTPMAVWPKVEIPPIMPRKTSASINPYSTAVAPFASRPNLARNPNIDSPPPIVRLMRANYGARC